MRLVPLQSNLSEICPQKWDWFYTKVVINIVDITEIHVTQRLEALHQGGQQ